MGSHKSPICIAGCRILGVEITDDAARIHEHPFTGSTAFMLGNEVSTGSLNSAMELYISTRPPVNMA